jgi:deoxyuridine 5'-triphosphate nucleotidohydrolase
MLTSHSIYSESATATNKPFIKFVKTHDDAQLPTKAHETDTGYDLYCVEDITIRSRLHGIVPVGLQVADIAPGYWYLILPRSGLGFKHQLQPHLGVIDSGYRGSLDVQIYNFSYKDYTFKKGDRVAQIAFYPLVDMVPSFTDEITEASRGAFGFGSSGK